MSQNNRSQSRSTLSESDMESVTMDCVRFLVNKGTKRNSIKRSDIMKFLSQQHEGASRYTNEILNKASLILKEVYGFRLVEVSNKSQFILVICHNSDNPDLHTPASEMNPENNTILIASLLHIFMSGGSVNEGSLWNFLEKAKLINEDDPATKKRLTNQFVKELYFNHVKIDQSDLTKFEWGIRAVEEMPKIYLLKILGEALDKPPDHWYEQYKEASNNTAAQ